MYNYGRRSSGMRYGYGDDAQTPRPYYEFPAQPETGRLSNVVSRNLSNDTIVDANKQRDYGRDNLYFNIDIINPLRTINPFSLINRDVPDILAVYEENLTQPLIQNPSDYYITVARFSIPGTSIPIFSMDIIPNQIDPNLTPYSFCLSYLGNDFPAILEYFSTGNTPVPPAPRPGVFQDRMSRYYYVYEYSHMIQMMNITLNTAFLALKAAFPAAPPTEAPFFVYDEITQLISLVAQYAYTGNATIQIFTTSLTYERFLNGMSVQFLGNNQPNGKDLLFLFPPMNINVPGGTIAPKVIGLLPKFNDAWVAGPGPVRPIPAGAQLETKEPRDYTADVNNPPFYLFNVQDFVTIQYWNSFRNIVFTTGNIPVQSEYIPSVQNFVPNTNTQATGAIAYRPILTDFQPILAAAGDARSQLQYYPQGPYRLLDMISNTPLQKIDLQIWWEDIIGNLHPIFIAASQIASVKLLFIKKNQ
jgi:hypothetical protein